MLVHLGQKVLEHLGHEVVARTNSIEALEDFRAQPDRFDIVITDFTMPNMTGVELSEELLRIRDDIPIILCTGFSEAINQVKTEETGIREILLKPISMSTFGEAIQRIRAQNRQEQSSPKATILIIDDEVQMREMLRQMFEREGYKVLDASNGKHALIIYPQEPADLIITDIFMPELDGIETIRRIRNDFPEVKVIAMSGGGNTVQGDYLRYATVFGADRVFQKPLNLREVLAAVQELTNKSAGAFKTAA